MTVKAQCKVSPVADRVPVRLRYNKGRLVVYFCQTITVNIGIDYCACALIKLIGSVLMIDVMLARIMAGQAIDLVAI